MLRARAVITSHKQLQFSHHHDMAWFWKLFAGKIKISGSREIQQHFIRNCNDRLYNKISIYMVLIFTYTFLSIIVTGTFFFQHYFRATLPAPRCGGSSLRMTLVYRNASSRRMYVSQPQQRSTYEAGAAWCSHLAVRYPCPRASLYILLSPSAKLTRKVENKNA